MDKACHVRIQNLYGELSNIERKIADYILLNSSKVVEMTIREFAENAGSAPSGITRFCQKIGYTGYSQMKLNLVGQIETGTDLILPKVSVNDTPSTVFDKVFSSSIKTLKDTLALMNKDTFDKAVEMILHSTKIEFYGVGTSATIAMDAYYRLMRIGYPAYCATDSQVMRIAATSMQPGQIAVGISHSGRAVETIDAIKYARAKGAGTIVLTSYQNSPICEHADLVLLVYSDELRYPIEAVSARIAHIAVLDALCVALALANNDRTVEHLKVMKNLFNEIRGK